MDWSWLFSSKAGEVTTISKEGYGISFLGCKINFVVDYLQKGKTINSEYYCSLLDQLDEEIREKKTGLKKKKIIFHQDNAPAHKNVLTMAKFKELKYE